MRAIRDPTAGRDSSFRECYRIRPSYGDFLNTFEMKARAGPYRSYDKYQYLTKEMKI